MTRLDVVNYISHNLRKVPQENNAKSGNESDSDQDANAAGVLENYTVNLNYQALINKIDPLIGREKEVERVIQTCAAAAKITRYWLVRRVWEKQPLRKAWQNAL